MKPHRVRMANSLVLHYGLHSKLDGVGRKGLRPAAVGFGPCRTLAVCRCWAWCALHAGFPCQSDSCRWATCHCSSKPVLPSLPRLQYYTPTRAGAEDMTAFHAEDYVDFLRTVTPDNMVGLLWPDDCSVSNQVVHNCCCCCSTCGSGWAAARHGRKLPDNSAVFFAFRSCSLSCTCAQQLHSTAALAAAFTSLPLWCLSPPQSQFTRELREFNMYEDCPVFDGLFEYCQVWEEAWEQQWLDTTRHVRAKGWMDCAMEGALLECMPCAASRRRRKLGQLVASQLPAASLWHHHCPPPAVCHSDLGGRQPGRGCEAQLPDRRHCHQLGGRPAPRQEGRGLGWAC